VISTTLPPIPTIHSLTGDAGNRHLNAARGPAAPRIPAGRMFSARHYCARLRAQRPPVSGTL